MYKKTVLPNGLRIVTHDIDDRDSLAIGFWVGVGGRYEEDRLKGAAHFLEHIVFKGSKKYSCEELKMRIEGVGGAMNAFTSEEQTCFYAKIPSKHVVATFDVLADMVLYPQITHKDVSKEKTVIVEEIKMYRDLPQYVVLELLDELLWPNHPLGKSLAGTPETVSAMTHKDLRAFHQGHYTPGNIVVSACGHLKHEKMVDLVVKKLGDLCGPRQSQYLKAEKSPAKPQTSFFKKDIEQMHLALGMPGFDDRHKDRYALGLLSIILGGNMSSRLFAEIREKRGLAYSISSSSKTLHDTGLFVVRAGVDNKKIVATVDVILKELKKMKRFGASGSEFTRGKDYLLGQLLLGLEDTMDHMLWLGEGVIGRDEMRTLKNVIREFEKIKPKDILRIANEVLNERCFNLAIVGPISGAQESQLKSLLE